jgi:hypothetical protein
MTDHETFEAWWLEQTRQGDPARRLNLKRDAFIAGMQAARATAEQRDSVIEECATVCEGGLISPKYWAILTATPSSIESQPLPGVPK